MIIQSQNLVTSVVHFPYSCPIAFDVSCGGNVSKPAFLFTSPRKFNCLFQIVYIFVSKLFRCWYVLSIEFSVSLSYVRKMFRSHCYTGRWILYKQFGSIFLLSNEIFLFLTKLKLPNIYCFMTEKKTLIDIGFRALVIANI